MPSALLRYTIRRHHLDQHGQFVTGKTLREIRGLYWDAPTNAPLHIDLGPLRCADGMLMRELASLPCAGGVVIESEDWQVAQNAITALHAEMAGEAA